MKRTFPVPTFYIQDPKAPSTPMEAMQRAGPDEPVESTMEYNSPLYEAMMESMASLTEMERDIVVMYFMEGLSVRQIAAITGISKSVVHRLLPYLKQRVLEAFSSNEVIQAYLNDNDEGE